MDRFIDNGIVYLKDNEWLTNQRIAGNILKQVLALADPLVEEGATTQSISDKIEEFILANNCTPTFKGYHDFPEAACISVNKELVHGVPNDKTILRNGDIVKVDVGVTYKGAITDAAFTKVVGYYLNPKHKMLVDTCKNCLDKAIEYIGKNLNKVRIGDIGYVIKKEASKIGANTIVELTGHGLEYNNPHWFPIVFNDGKPNTGLLLYPDMTIAIEPMLVFGPNKIKVDKHAILTEDIGAHFEHTIYIHYDSVEIIA